MGGGMDDANPGDTGTNVTPESRPDPENETFCIAVATALHVHPTFPHAHRGDAYATGLPATYRLHFTATLNSILTGMVATYKYYFNCMK